MIQFSGAYQITGFRNENGKKLTGDLKDKAIMKFFWSPSRDFPWRGRSGSIKHEDGTSSRYYSYPEGDKLFLAIDDEKGSHGSKVADKVNKLRVPDGSFWSNATQVLFLSTIANVYLGIKNALYVKPVHTRLMNKTFKQAQSAELVATTSKQGAAEEKIEFVKVTELAS